MKAENAVFTSCRSCKQPDVHKTIRAGRVVSASDLSLTNPVRSGQKSLRLATRLVLPSALRICRAEFAFDLLPNWQLEAEILEVEC
jgi:hypothetical protein